ncbi:MAG TPA: SGNH/GDSL hydrolase family protein, partial [Nannocystis sp.]
MEPETSTSTTDLPTTGDDTVGESSSTGDEDTTTGDDLPHPELYPTDRVQSPITAFVAAKIREIAAAPAGADKDPGVFAKIGGGSTASANFMNCLADEMMIQDLPMDEAALKTTIDHFRAVALVDMTTSFNRASVAAMNGFTSDALVTMPTPIAMELEAIKPRFAQVLVGTHDLDKDQPAQLWVFAEKMLDMVDALTINGVVPILTTIPQRTDIPAKDLFVPRYNAVLRAVAQGRQIPLVDLNLALAGLPMSGVAAEGDLSVFVSAMVDRPCHFGEAALMYGYNVRNLEALRSLDRARQVVVEEVPELDTPGPRLAGAGTMADPYQIPSLPFVDLRSTADSTSDIIDNYLGACDGMKDESGPEVFYKLEVEAPIDVR